MTPDSDRTLIFPIQQYALPNGLHVVLEPDPSLPHVAVNLWYNVGSKDEKPGRTGLAHLFEHLMFEGSANHDDDYFRPLQEIGASVNGSTSSDRTHYHEVVPSRHLELAIWMEAERLENLLGALTIQKLENQRSVVLNERRQRYENQPYGRVGETLGTALYLAGHPYSWPVIGWASDIAAATFEDVCNFFQSFYRPNNAMLCLVGDFEPESAKTLIEKHFAGIAGGPVPPFKMQGRLAAAARMRLEDRIALSRLDLVWHTVPRFAPDEAALDFVAEILAGRSKDSRLKRSLMISERLVRGISASNDAQLLAGRLHIRCHAMPGVELGRIEEAILEQLGDLCRMPPTEEEIERVRRDFEHQMYNRIETALGRSHAYCHQCFYRGGVHAESIAEELDLYRKVNVDEVLRVVEMHLRSLPTVLEVVPGAAPAAATTPAFAEPAEKQRRGVLGALPKPGAARRFVPPKIEWVELSSGLRLAVATQRRVPRVELDLIFPVGSVADPPDLLGLSRLHAEALDEGAGDKDAIELARILDRLGARLSVGNSLEEAVVSMQTLSDRLDEALSVLAEVLLRPRFDSADVEREKQRLISELKHRERDPHWLAEDAFDALVFGPDHPYGRRCDGVLQTVNRISAAHVRDFHQAQFSLDRATLAVVGDCTVDEIAGCVERRLTPGTRRVHAKRLVELPAPCPPAERVRIIDRESSPQSVIRLGCLGAPRRAADYFPLLILNSILGGQFVSRLNSNLRERRGFTYGVRSAFSMRRNAGSFCVSTDVQAASTSEAIREILGEIAGLTGSRPIREVEFQAARQSLAGRYPARFETAGGIAACIGQLVSFELPRDFWDGYLDNLASVSIDDVESAAHRRLRVENMKLAAVGDSRCVSGLAEQFG